MISYDQYAGEKHLVEEFVGYVQRKPFYFKDQNPVFLFVWGYELWMPSGGRHGTAGIIDMLGTDSLGQTWLIEAKHSQNPELEPGLWELQVVNYIETLSSLSVEEVVLQSQRYLSGKSQGMKKPTFLTNNCSGLLEAFELWQEALEVDDYKKSALQLFQKTFNNIKNKNVYCTILADEFRNDVWNNRPVDQFHCGYISCYGINENFSVQVNTDTGPVALGKVVVLDEIETSWAEIKRNRLIHPSPNVIRLLIKDECYEMYDFLLDGLKDLGWDGRSFTEKSKSYVISLGLNKLLNIKIMIGLVDYDASCHSIDDKLAGKGGFKCDIDFTDFKHERKMWELIEPVINELIVKAGFRGRGKAKSLGKRALTEMELSLWDGKITHQPVEKWRDFTGRQGELDHIKAMLNILPKAIEYCRDNNCEHKSSVLNEPSSVKFIPEKHDVILVDDISSITTSVFSFKYRKRLLDKLPFVLKKRSKEFNEVQYHLDENDLMKINESFSDIFPFSMCTSYPQYNKMTRTEYGELMKYRLCQYVVTGEIGHILSVVSGNKKEISIRWDENVVPIEKPLL